MDRTGISRGLHPDSIVHVVRVLRPHREFPAGDPHHAVGRGSAGGFLFSTVGRNWFCGCAPVACGWDRHVVKPTARAPAIATTPTQVQARRLRRLPDMTSNGFWRRLSNAGLELAMLIRPTDLPHPVICTSSAAAGCRATGPAIDVNSSEFLASEGDCVPRLNAGARVGSVRVFRSACGRYSQSSLIGTAVLCRVTAIVTAKTARGRHVAEIVGYTPHVIFIEGNTLLRIDVRSESTAW